MKLFISKQLVWTFIVVICTVMIITYVNVMQPSSNRLNVFFNYTSKYRYIAAIVDDRASQTLVNIVQNVVQHLPTDWKVQIITRVQHWSFYNQSSLRLLIKSNRVFLTPLEEPNNGLSNVEFMNYILSSASFWHQVQGDKVLFFQTDSVLCSNSLYNLTDFLEYDFIGAPWHRGGCCNGGLSLRNRIKILQMLESGHVQYKLHSANEDEWFAQYLPYFNGYIAPVSIGQRFSVETIFHSRPFGVHGPRVSTIGVEKMIRLCNECPEVNLITPTCRSMVNTNISYI
ncbi:unnamed protein product [Adineta ricciae]|uniref:DUF5672 domain-containing protein n=1 Tax=Adineta ricciae TaxID=249248 RepID=A0A815LKL5_ADIRI|nr:unnamed protein product [Adineta ricciae]